MTENNWVMRNPSHVVLTGRDHVLFVGDGDPATKLCVASPTEWSLFLQRLAAPNRLDELAPPAELDDNLLEKLTAQHHFLSGSNVSELITRRHAAMAACRSFHLDPHPAQLEHVLIGCTGSVIAGLVPQTILSLVLSGFQRQLDVILSKMVQRFLTRELLEAYGVRCWSDGFERQDGIRVPHVNLAKSPEVICVLPSTAQSMNSIAQSACSDFLSLTITASHAPVVLCPAMNETMWTNPGVRRNAEQLRDDGRYIMEPTVLFAAAEFRTGAPLGYGGHGSLWAGPGVFMRALSAVAHNNRS